MEDIRAWARKQLDPDTGLPLFTADECQAVIEADDPYRAVFGIAKQIGYGDGLRAGLNRGTKRGRGREALRQVLIENGLQAGSSLHSWRCEHPDRYGECSCLDELLDDIEKALETWHGTLNGYNNHKCRCRLCKDANRDWSKQFREKQRAQLNERRTRLARSVWPHNKHAEVVRGTE